jgi:hypothetical protein
MRLNVSLNEELGIRIWSFPMRYQPTDLADRSHVGEHWTRYELRSLQIILQATHGVVSGAPEFFKRAFGDTVEEFRAILRRPHRYIFNREWYENGGGMAEFEDFEREIARVGTTDQEELLALLSSCDPREIGGLRTTTRRVRTLLEFYNPIAKSEEAEIWQFQKRQSMVRQLDVPEDELVEDAGLLDEPLAAVRSSRRARNARLSVVAP